MARTQKIVVDLGDRSYPIVVGPGLIASAGTLIRSSIGCRSIVIVSNARLMRLHGSLLSRSLRRASFSVDTLLVPDSERAKSMETITRLAEKLCRVSRGRSIAIVALGGGVVGDTAGFLAAIYKRGIPYIQVPTTLLAQVDSSIGGKVAADLSAAKNLVGAFFQPRIVLSDTRLLSTLPVRQLANGLAEVIKYGVALDKSLFDFVEANAPRLIGRDDRALGTVVARCSALKADIVERDERDLLGTRMILNYGHTIGHAIEAATAYSARFGHGEAVAVGMIAANRIALSLGLFSDNEAERVERILLALGLPTRAEGVSATAIYNAHRHDKKFSASTNRFVLPRRIGNASVVTGVPDRLIRYVIGSIT